MIMGLRVIGFRVIGFRVTGFWVVGLELESSGIRGPRSSWGAL